VSTSGGSGTLTITETGGALTAAYAATPFVQGSLKFVATTGSAAAPTTANETMQVACIGSAGASAMDSVPVSSSTLTIDGSWVVLSFVGNMPASGDCAGAVTSVSVLCAK